MRNLSAIFCFCAVLSAVPATMAAGDAEPATDPESEVRALISQAQGMLRFALVEKGASPEFAGALDLLSEAERLNQSAGLAPEARESFSELIEATRENVNQVLASGKAQFYGRFPLARLIYPTVFARTDLSATEELFWDPREAAVADQSRRVIDEIIRLQYPHVVFRSDPPNRYLELTALHLFADAPRPITHTRTELVEVLSPKQLAAFDRGDMGPQMVDVLLNSFDAVNLLVVTVREGLVLQDGYLVFVEGDFYKAGHTDRTDNFLRRGFARDRRDQSLPLVLGQVALLVIAIVYARIVRWSRVAPWTPLRRVLTGVVLFGFGMVAMVLVAMALTKVTPVPMATIEASWWWPAAFGPIVVIGIGLAAWILEAKVSTIMPGAGGERAVASIFALTALGACAWFLGPLLLLERSYGFVVFVPFVLAATSLAALFGAAARTGPPVPNAYMVGPLLLSPLLGIAIFETSVGMLWILVAAAALLYAAAWYQYRYAVAHGTEEVVDEEAAARADAERLQKIGGKLKGKLPL